MQLQLKLKNQPEQKINIKCLYYQPSLNCLSYMVGDETFTININDINNIFIIDIKE